MNQTPFHERVAQKLIEQLKQGTAPWQRPWDPGNPGALMPINPITQKRYKGINAIQLMSENHTDTRWMTYKQALSIEAQVKKGEKGTVIQYWKFSEEQLKKDEQGIPILDANGKPVKIEVRLERPRVFYATVFNAEQIEGLPALTPSPLSWNPIDRAEQLLITSGASVIHSEINRAFYRPSTDSIHLPDKSLFLSANNYYATALHELGHWSGHSSRLDRDLIHPFGSVGYAKEELRAEITSMILGDELGIGHDSSQHASYIESWIKVLQDDPLELFRAAAEAEKMQQFLLSFEQVHIHEQQKKQGESLEELDNDLNQNTLTLDEGIAMLNEGAVKEQTAEPKIWLDIPFQQKEVAKELAGKLPDGRKAIGWDKETSRWFARPGADLGTLKPWLANQIKDSEIELQAQVASQISTEKTWLAVPFSAREAVKQIAGTLSNGQRAVEWDKAAKSWFAHPGANLQKLKPWLLNSTQARQAPALTPEEEFSQVLKSIGSIVTGEHPIMDGKPYRISVEGDKKGEKSGFYVGHLDNHPAGYVKNNRTGVEMKWKSKGYVLSDEEKTKFRAVALEKSKIRAIEQEAMHQKTAQKLRQKLTILHPLSEPTPYLKSKGIQVHPGVYTDGKQKTTCIPAIDKEGVVWNIQYIMEDGIKRFAKDSRKEGCFHVLGDGGLSALAKSPVIIIAEGYATAATLKEAVDMPVVSAFDSGNLKVVAQGLKEKFPNTPILIAADDDKHLELTQRINPGKEKAFEAAEAVKGFVIIPIFAPGEQAQNPKKFSDFNDLVKNSCLGLAGVKNQVKPLIKRLIRQNQVNCQRKVNKVSCIA